MEVATIGVSSLGQQSHEVSWGGGVRAQWRPHHMASSMPPALVPVACAVSTETGSYWFSKHDMACGSIYKELV